MSFFSLLHECITPLLHDRVPLTEIVLGVMSWLGNVLAQKETRLGADTKISLEVYYTPICGRMRTSACEKESEAIASHYKNHIWPHAAFDHKFDSLICSFSV